MSIKLELLDCKGIIYPARGSRASLECVKSFHPWSWCMPPHISCHIWQLLPATTCGNVHQFLYFIKGLLTKNVSS